MQSGSAYHRFVAHGKPESAQDINETVFENIKLILDGRSPEEYCGSPANPKLHYVTGRKKGKPVAARGLRYNTDEETSPRLDLIAAIAAKEKLHPFQLLLPELGLRGGGDQLWAMFPALTQDGKDAVLGTLNRVYADEHPEASAMNPFGKIRPPKEGEQLPAKRQAHQIRKRIP